MLRLIGGCELLLGVRVKGVYALRWTGDWLYILLLLSKLDT